jgi:cytochrome c oxidase assembly protein subunit 19
MCTFVTVTFAFSFFYWRKGCQDSMSNGVTSNNARVSPRPPDLGAFPLDHFRECKSEIGEYYKCLKSHDYLAPLCRDETRMYLQCRMDKGLMTPADVDGFGIPKTDFVPTRQHKIDLKERWLKQKMNQVTVVWENNYKRDDLSVPDGFEKERGDAAQ